MSSDYHTSCVDILKATLSPEGKRLLAGYYDPVQRRIDVKTKLDKALKIFESTDFFRCNLEEENVITQKEKSVDDIQLEIDDLKEAVTVYMSNGHFTKDYRTFEATCLKLQQTVDNYNHQKDPVTRKWQRQAVRHIHNILEILSQKVHQDGKCCKDCELYGTKWQQ